MIELNDAAVRLSEGTPGTWSARLFGKYLIVGEAFGGAHSFLADECVCRS